MSLPDRADIERASALVHRSLSPTPQICWPLLSARCGCEVWVKHENHTPIGAFKVRGGVVYMAGLKQESPGVARVITATRGNHGQSVAYAARRAGFAATIVVPHGNSADKNAAMRAFGADLVEHGRDFQEALEHAQDLAQEQGLTFVPSFHPRLVAGVASCYFELFEAVPDLDTLYVPIGLGSGICAAIAAREALGLKMRIVGVVAEQAPTYALSFAAGAPVTTDSADTLADGLACRVPVAEAVEAILEGAERVITVSEAEILAAMGHYFTDTHNIAEGAGAAPLAALLREAPSQAGRKIGLVLSGGNVDRALFARALAAQDS